MTDVISNMRDLCDYFSADEPAQLNRHIYKYTDCGAYITVFLPKPEDDIPKGYVLTHSSGHVPNVEAIHSGDIAWRNLTMDTSLHSFAIGTIVEGSDAGVDPEIFVLPVEKSDVGEWIDYMEAESERLWREANEEEDW